MAAVARDQIALTDDTASRCRVWARPGMGTSPVVVRRSTSPLLLPTILRRFWSGGHSQAGDTGQGSHPRPVSPPLRGCQSIFSANAAGTRAGTGALGPADGSPINRACLRTACTGSRRWPTSRNRKAGRSRHTADGPASLCRRPLGRSGEPPADPGRFLISSHRPGLRCQTDPRCLPPAGGEERGAAGFDQRRGGLAKPARPDGPRCLRPTTGGLGRGPCAVHTTLGPTPSTPRRLSPTGVS